MIADLIGTMFEELGRAAVFNAEAISFVWDGPPSRMIAVGNGGWFSIPALPGHTVVVNRAFRLRVEYVDHVKLMPPCCVVSRWTVN